MPTRVKKKSPTLSRVGLFGLPSLIRRISAGRSPYAHAKKQACKQDQFHAVRLGQRNPHAGMISAIPSSVNMNWRFIG